MTSAVFAFGEIEAQAAAVADRLGIALHRISVHAFPDGESLVQVPVSDDTALLFRSLDNPNGKLVEIVLAASALRDMGAKRVILVAPYLAYMRQDKAFQPGEAVSQRVIGRLLASHFDGLVTIDPHLHRTGSLGEAVPGIPTASLSAAPALAQAIAGGLANNPILVGPDSESRPWVESIAHPLGLDMLVGEKQRLGDREVSLVLPDGEKARGRPAILVDDLISSGGTLLACAALLRKAGAISVEVIATHCLASAADLRRLAAAGIASVRATDSVSGPVSSIPLAAILADTIHAHGWD